VDVLDGRVAIVTGAGRGIGRAVARRLAMRGADVLVNDIGSALDGTGRDIGPAGQVAQEILASGGRAIANTVDVSDFTGAAGIVEEAVTTFGRLDIVVNVAGIVRDRMLFNMTEAEWDDVIRVHLKGTFNMSRHAAAHWRQVKDESGSRRLINCTRAA
jgi:NAD(P)-dependent dehydrogenase (short-subunit alcohol dehydrogenase family)